MEPLSRAQCQLVEPPVTRLLLTRTVTEPPIPFIGGTPFPIDHALDQLVEPRPYLILCRIGQLVEPPGSLSIDQLVEPPVD